MKINIDFVLRGLCIGLMSLFIIMVVIMMIAGEYNRSYIIMRDDCNGTIFVADITKNQYNSFYNKYIPEYDGLNFKDKVIINETYKNLSIR